MSFMRVSGSAAAAAAAEDEGEVVSTSNSTFRSALKSGTYTDVPLAPPAGARGPLNEAFSCLLNFSGFVLYFPIFTVVLCVYFSWS